MPLNGQTDNASAPYESGELRAVCGATLRPGGLELTREALGICAFPPGARLLDLGCGPGGTLKLLTEMGFEPLGLDRSPTLLAEAARFASVVEADFHHLPLDDGSQDGILAECVLSLAGDRAQVLAECARVLKPGGRLALSDVYLKTQPESPSESRGCLSGAVALEEMSAGLRAAGFEILETRDHSQALTELAAQLIWRHGSAQILSSLWGGCSGPGGGKYGYALLVAARNPSNSISCFSI